MSPYSIPLWIIFTPAGADVADAQIAVRGASVAKTGSSRRQDSSSPPTMRAVSVLETPDAARRARVDEVDAAIAQEACAGRTPCNTISSVHDDVAGRERHGEVVEDLFGGGSGGDHAPDGPRTIGESRRDIADPVRRHRTRSGHFGEARGVRIPGDDAVSALSSREPCSCPCAPARRTRSPRSPPRPSAPRLQGGGALADDFHHLLEGLREGDDALLLEPCAVGLQVDSRVGEHAPRGSRRLDSRIEPIAAHDAVLQERVERLLGIVLIESGPASSSTYLMSE